MVIINKRLFCIEELQPLEFLGVKEGEKIINRIMTMSEDDVDKLFNIIIKKI